MSHYSQNAAPVLHTPMMMMWCVPSGVWWWWWCWCTSVKIGKIVWIWEYDPGPMQIVPKCGKYRKIAASCTTLVYAHWMNVLSTDLELFYNPCVLMRLLCFEKHVLLITSLFAALAISLFFVSCVSTSKWLSARLVPAVEVLYERNA